MAKSKDRNQRGSATRSEASDAREPREDMAELEANGASQPTTVEASSTFPQQELDALLTILQRFDVTTYVHERGSGSSRERLFIRRGQAVVHAAPTTSLAHATPLVGPAPVPASAPVAVAAAEPDKSEQGITYVTSPLVGTFYRAPGPNAAPFVEVGTSIRQGQRLCIVEAMKLMNEIEAELEGTIVEILVETGKPVEYGQKLFKVRTR